MHERLDIKPQRGTDRPDILAIDPFEDRRLARVVESQEEDAQLALFDFLFIYLFPFRTRTEA